MSWGVANRVDVSHGRGTRPERGVGELGGGDLHRVNYICWTNLGANDSSKKKRRRRRRRRKKRGITGLVASHCLHDSRLLSQHRSCFGLTQRGTVSALYQWVWTMRCVQAVSFLLLLVVSTDLHTAMDCPLFL